MTRAESIDGLDAAAALSVAELATAQIADADRIRARALRRARERGATIAQLAEAAGVSYDAMRMRLARGGSLGHQG